MAQVNLGENGVGYQPDASTSEHQRGQNLRAARAALFVGGLMVLLAAGADQETISQGLRVGIGLTGGALVFMSGRAHSQHSSEN